ncbi:MAG: precorrin-2 C(20)-methyltransferase [Actinomycetota bacterium]|nr:precorrin-2 C(20)-methyltransferase [Actinomycetota bacterium]
MIGVGVGPGAPDLLTLRALHHLQRADVIFAPSMASDVQSRAESVVVRADPNLRVRRLVFAIIRDDAARQAAHRAAAIEVGEALSAGLSAAFVTLGDPNVYSTFHHLLREVRRIDPAVAVETVPGIMAFQALAAEASLVVTDEVESLHIVTAVDGPVGIESALEDTASTVVIYKGGRHLGAIVDLLRAHDRLEGALLGELMGLEGSKVELLTSVDQRSASYLSTVIVPPRRSTS